ncbi:hypothetical protein [Taklimakanibacter deserti]|uniref:hypothetical protein n=1 Tax=Taklimakanibacter deserti TaxID=2267839 RepID=UPI000E6567E7
MRDHSFMTGIQTGETIWHEAMTGTSPEGRRVVLALFKGRVEFANDEHGTYAGVETISIYEETEPFSGTHTFILADGSTSNQTFEGVVTRRDAPDRVGGIGTWKIIDGTGRLKDLRGGGSFTWSIEGERYYAKFGSRTLQSVEPQT